MWTTRINFIRMNYYLLRLMSLLLVFKFDGKQQKFKYTRIRTILFQTILRTHLQYKILKLFIVYGSFLKMKIILKKIHGVNLQMLRGYIFFLCYYVLPITAACSL